MSSSLLLDEPETGEDPVLGDIEVVKDITEVVGDVVEAADDVEDVPGGHSLRPDLRGFRLGDEGEESDESRLKAQSEDSPRIPTSQT